VSERTGIDVEQIGGTSLSLHPAASLLKNPPDLPGLYLVQSEHRFVISKVRGRCGSKRSKDLIEAERATP
jgi:hypothetical protein